MPTRRTSRNRTALLLAIPIVILLAVALFRPLAGPAMRTITAIAAPAYAAGAQVTRGFSRVFSDEPKTFAQLKGEIESLRVENAKLRDLAVDNDALKAALAYEDRDIGAPLTARVLSRTDEDVFLGLVIDRGADDGVLVGQPVIVGAGVIIGKIFEARAKTASVLLLADPKSRLAVAMQHGTGTVGVLEGDRGLASAINLIPQTVSISPGDSVVTSGIEPGIRRGLLVGTVDAVTQRTQEPFQSATVVPAPSAVQPVYVQVLTNGADASANAAAETP